MSLLVESAVKVSLIVVAALAATVLLGRRSAALRHWLLSAAVVCAALAPVFQPVAPLWRLPLDPAAAQTFARPALRSGAGVASSTAGDAGGDRSAASPPGVPLARAALTLWAAGAALSALVLAIGLARLAWLAARFDPVAGGRWAGLARELSAASGLRRPIRLLQSDDPTLLVTWGAWRPDIILPAGALEWTDDRIRVVLLHELAHIRRGDWLTQLAAQCLQAVYWFNPLVWIAAMRLRQESEQACDDAVLSGGVDAAEYATHLFELARSAIHNRGAFYPAPAMARPSSLERRFAAMLSASTNRRPLTRPARIGSGCAVAAVTVLVAGLGAAQTFSTFSGSVFDASNRVLPGVTLVLTNVQSQAKHEVKTDRTGRFEFVGLPPGDYTWSTALAGFASLKGTVTVTGRDVQRDLALQVGSLEETITIRASSSIAPAADRAPREVRRQERAPLQASPCAAPAGAIGGNIKAPRKLVDVRPRYPEHLRLAGVGGVVVLDATIGTDGTVRETHVVSAADPGLADAASEAVRLWEFSQTLLNCEPVEVRMKVTANFAIEP